MSSNRYFHGKLDNFHELLTQWRVTKQERKFLHSVQHTRRIVYRFTEHIHPYAPKLMTTLINQDVAGLQRLDTETDLRQPFFTNDYLPTQVVDQLDPAVVGKMAVAVLAQPNATLPLAEQGLPVHDLDFDYQSGAYSVYNWELFYHTPYTIALNLSKNGRYREAQQWYHYIFDPTDNSNPSLGPKRFWKVKPFKIDEVEHIEQVLFNLATGDDTDARDATVRAISAWRSKPFRPHLIARSRPTAYMYTTVMAYLDNLIAWGDSLFQQDTRESINEAMQLYVLSANILGPHPQPVPKRGSNKKQTYVSLRNNLDEFGNAAVKIEAEIAFDLYPAPQPSETKPEHAILESIGHSLYFCVPHNEKLLGYWDTVADRLFKIRNSLNLQGTFRQLPLFAPPIDPAIFARAVAAGVDISAIIDGSANALLPVRVQFLLPKAIELAQEVKVLGSQILAALEKKDNETLSVLRANHEVTLLNLVENVKYAQWQEAIKAREGIEVNLANAFQRFRHYSRLLGDDDNNIKLPKSGNFDRDVFEKRNSALEEANMPAPDPQIVISSSFRDGGHKVSDEEAHELDLAEATQIAQEVATAIEATGSYLNIIPDTGAAVKPLGLGVEVKFGGTYLGHLFRALSSVAHGVAGRIGHEAGRTAKMGSFARREQEWAFQRKTAAGELTAMFKQLRGSEIREYIAKREHEHHLTQIKQSKDVLEFLTNQENLRKGDQRKTTTEDFYLWMKREAQGLHAKAFQLAYDVAKKTEIMMRFELPDYKQDSIGSGYLAGREGLFAGEKLYLDLKRMELAFIENNQREFEITRHISLREWFPAKLIDLRNTGKCDIKLPEQLFDLDCPGHSFRRIKTLSVTIPCVAGPYASINCSLSLNQSYIRRAAGGYPADPDNDTTNFIMFPAAVKSIVTSNAQNDNGTFEGNLHEERYLPFEGGGAICSLSLELLGKPHSFDHDTISDVVLTIRYTARPGGNRQNAETSANNWLKANAAQLFSMRHEFASEWSVFKRPIAPNPTTASLQFSLGPQHFPYRLQAVTEKAKRMHLSFGGNPSGNVELFRIDGSMKKSLGITQLVSPAVFDTTQFTATGDFELRFDSNELDDLWILVDWSMTP